MEEDCQNRTLVDSDIAARAVAVNERIFGPTSLV